MMIDALKLAPLRLSPDTLRGWSVSTDFAFSLRTLGEIQRRGRWKVASSVRRYEQAGRLARQARHRCGGASPVKAGRRDAGGRREARAA